MRERFFRDLTTERLLPGIFTSVPEIVHNLSPALVGSGVQLAIDPQATDDRNFGNVRFAKEEVSQRRLSFGAKL